MRNLIIFFLFFTLLLSIWLYRDSFNAYFFQDDWFTLRISQAQSWKEVIVFFVPRSDVIYYRPLGMQIYFFLTRSIFGLNPYAFRLIHFFIHGINIILVYLVISQISRNRQIALLTSFFFGTSTIHYIPFMWASTFAFPLGLVFILLSFFIYLKWTKTHNNKLIIVLIIIEVLALASNEMALVIPLLIISHMFINKKVNKKIITYISVFPLLYILIRLVFLPHLTDSYTIEFGKKTFKALITYFLWLFNWPDEIRNQLENIFRLNFVFITDFFIYFSILSMASIFFIVNIANNLFQQTKKNNPEYLRTVKLSIVFIIIGLLFPIPFSNHTYPYYLSVTSIGIYTLLSYSLLRNSSHSFNPIKSFVLMGGITIWLLCIVYTLNFNSKIHWTRQRSIISKIVVTDLINRYPMINSETEEIYLPNDPYLKDILSGNESFMVLFNDKNIKTNYYGELNNLWKTSNEDEKYRIDRLKLNYIE